MTPSLRKARRISRDEPVCRSLAPAECVAIVIGYFLFHYPCDPDRLRIEGKIVRQRSRAIPMRSLPFSRASAFRWHGSGSRRDLYHSGFTLDWRRPGFETVLLETRHVKGALSAMVVKTDRKDARELLESFKVRKTVPGDGGPVF